MERTQPSHQLVLAAFHGTTQASADSIDAICCQCSVALHNKKFAKQKELPISHLTMEMQNTVDGGCGRIEASAVVDSTFCVADRHHEPYEGFATRILSSRKSERDGSIISRGLGCRGIPDNHRSDTVLNEKGEKRRESCTAMIVVKRDKPGTWIVRKFVRDHNHPLVVSLSKKRPTFDEKDKKIQELTAELRVKKRLSAAYRDQLLTLMKDTTSNHARRRWREAVVSMNRSLSTGLPYQSTTLSHMGSFWMRLLSLATLSPEFTATVSLAFSS
ncbi:unnamed protein product [Fraxinus pennsylvanica]|uniref:FAR1 domain-containing protein n=1 Tax=Fraxinus pennsylvanica TaxID=56036 RepID=A0AAD2A1P0_9LAMI|nr:unnamed protein product [Fraxinus pennsylvanica]